MLKKLLIVALLTVALPCVVIGGYFGWLLVSSAFPGDAVAKQRFEEGTGLPMPKQATQIYLRIAVPSPMDRGGTALRFTVPGLVLNDLLASAPRAGRWKVLEEEFHCDCVQCLRYAEPVRIAPGAMYWRRGDDVGDYGIMAVDVRTSQVFWCERDT